MNYKDIFLNNNYEIEDNFTFTLIAYSQVKNKKIFKKNFAIITAFNPCTKKLTTKENQKRNQLLEAEIKTFGYDYLSARGFLDDHSEEGFLIFDISFEDSIMLALKHEQYAIFYNSDEKIAYYEAKSKKIIIEEVK